MDKNHPTLAPIAVSPEEAAHMIGLGRTTIFELIQTGELPAAKVGRRTLISVSELHALIERLSSSDKQTHRYDSPEQEKLANYVRLKHRGALHELAK